MKKNPDMREFALAACDAHRGRKLAPVRPEDDEALLAAIGLLGVYGKEKLYAIAGQIDRAVSISNAIKAMT